MPADALAPKDASASAGMVLAVKDRQHVLLFQSKVSTLFQKSNWMSFQGLIKDKTTSLKYYWIFIWCIVNGPWEMFL